jgi:hypothetical protein
VLKLALLVVLTDVLAVTTDARVEMTDAVAVIITVAVQVQIVVAVVKTVAVAQVQAALEERNN